MSVFGGLDIFIIIFKIVLLDRLRCKRMPLFLLRISGDDSRLSIEKKK